jgi:hypothetical protein
MTVDQRATGMGAVVRRSVTHTIGKGRFAGKTIELMQLGLRDISQTQEECTEDYKRAYLQTYTRNADLMPAELQGSLIRDAFAAAAEMHYEGLPRKRIELPKVENGKIVTGPDGKMVTEIMLAEYGMWWSGSTVKGMLYTTWLSMRKCQSQAGITLDDTDMLFMDAMDDLREAVEKLGRLANPRVLGNADAPAANVEQPARETSRQRRKRLEKERAREATLTGL